MTQMTQESKKPFMLQKEDDITVLRGMIAELKSLESSASITTKQRNRCKDSIKALTNAVDALETLTYA